MGFRWREIVFYYATDVQGAHLSGTSLYEVGRRGKHHLDILLINTLESFEIVGARTWQFVKLWISISTQTSHMFGGLHHFPTSRVLAFGKVLILTPTIIWSYSLRELLNPQRLLLMPPHTWIAVTWFGILRAMPASINSLHGVFHTTDPVTIWIRGNCVNMYKEVWNLQGSRTQRMYLPPKTCVCISGWIV